MSVIALYMFDSSISSITSIVLSICYSRVIACLSVCAFALVCLFNPDNTERVRTQNKRIKKRAFKRSFKNPVYMFVLSVDCFLC